MSATNLHDTIRADASMEAMTPYSDTIVLGDALRVLADVPARSVDLTVFSPPYDGIRDYGKDWALDCKTLGDSLFRVTKDGGVCAVVIGDGTKDFAKSLTTFRWAVDWVDRAGWRLFECCIYERHGNPGAWWKATGHNARGGPALA